MNSVLIKCVIEKGVPAVSVHRGHIYFCLAKERDPACRDPVQLWTPLLESCSPSTVNHRAVSVIEKCKKSALVFPDKQSQSHSWAPSAGQSGNGALDRYIEYLGVFLAHSSDVYAMLTTDLMLCV